MSYVTKEDLKALGIVDETPLLEQRRLDLALRRMTRTDSPETSTVTCSCGSLYTWEGLDGGLEDWLDEHADHVLAP